MTYSLEKQREYRKKTGNAATKKYEKTPKGFLMRLYRNMQSRVTGVQKLKHHLYSGKELLPRDEFYEWALGSDEFHRLFQEWERSEYDRKLSPSVDRIDSAKGYSLENMEWVTHSENSRRGSINRHKTNK
jgi:hypothetical protein